MRRAQQLFRSRASDLPMCPLCRIARYSTMDHADSAEGIREFNNALRDVFGVDANDATPLAHKPSQSLDTNQRSFSPPQADCLKVSDLSHTDEQGQASMVNVGSKAETQRHARAAGVVYLGKAAYDAVRQNALQKGDVLSVAQLAGIMAAKQTANLIPLCHSLALDRIQVHCNLQEQAHAVNISAEAQCTSRTGVEMEAMTAVSVAALTVYDMCKAVSKDISIGDIRLLYKSGGKSGVWER